MFKYHICILLAVILSLYAVIVHAEPEIPIIEDTKNNNLEKVRKLVEKGADVNIIDTENNTPLLYAVLKNNNKLVEYLVNHGADVNYKHSYTGSTALLISVMRANHKNIRFLISKGADVNVEAAPGITPLFAAAKNKDKKSWDILAEHGADPTLKCEGGETLPKLFKNRYSEQFVTNYYKEYITHKIQELLIKQGYDAGTVDGRYGPKTKAAIEEYQNKYGMTVDGQASTEVLNSLEYDNSSLSIQEQNEITHLIAERKINVDIVGNGIKSINLSVVNNTKNKIHLSIPVGTYFVSGNNSSQNMLSTENVVRKIKARKKTNIIIPVACANHYRAVPDANVSFEILRHPKNRELVQLSKILGKEEIPFPVKQAAIWIVTDDIGVVRLENLRERYTNKQIISYFDMFKAMKLVDDSGIDIVRKFIWSDRWFLVHDYQIDEEHFRWFIERIPRLAFNINLQTKRYNKNPYGKYHQSLIKIAAENGFLNSIKYLLSQGADVNDKTACSTCLNNTPLHLASKGAYIEVVNYLLDNGADVKALDKKGETALSYAASNSSKQSYHVVKTLVKHGIDVNKRDDLVGYTPLMDAVASYSFDAVKALVESGANVNLASKSGDTALSKVNLTNYTGKKVHPKIIKYLLMSGANPDAKNLLCEVANFGDINTLNEIISAGANINGEKNDGLHCAVKYGNVETVKFLLKHGASFNTKNKDGKTPIEVAKSKGYDEIVKIIVNHTENKKQIH